MTSLNLKFVPSKNDSSSSSLSRLHTQVIQTVQAAYPDLKPRLLHLADHDSVVVQGVTELDPGARGGHADRATPGPRLVPPVTSFLFWKSPVRLSGRPTTVSHAPSSAVR